MKKKALAALLAATLAIGLLAGCGSNKESASSEASVSNTASASSTASASVEEPAVEEYAPSYPYETDVTLKLFIGGGQLLSHGRTGYEEVPWWQNLSEKTGIELELMYPTVGADADAAYNIMLTDEELPHIVMGYYITPANMAKLIEDGIALNINDYIEEYAPDYYEVINKDTSDMKKNQKVINVDGTYPAFNTFRETGWQATYEGMMIRQDWLDALGLEVPSTIDEMEKVLAAFKDNYGGIMLMNLKRMGQTLGTAYGAFGTRQGFYVEDGTVKACLEAEGLKDFVAKLNEWYEKGFIDANWMNASGDYYNQISLEDKLGVTCHYMSRQTTFLTQAEEAGVIRDWVGIPALTNEAGDPVHWIQTEYSTAMDLGVYITTACDTEEELKAAMAWCNWAYTDEGSMYWNFGDEGVAYELVDGQPRFTDMMWEGEGIDYNMREYTGASGCAFGIALDALGKAKNSPQTVASVDAWTSNQDCSDYLLPKLSYSTEDTQTITDINTAIDTYASEMITKFIVGEESIDKWDEFIADTQKMGQPTLIKIHQAAYDEYMSN